jgi:hypothetical protein
MIKHFFQPLDSSLCGQTCVAMIAGISLEESIAAFGGTRGATRTKHLAEALQKLGVKCGDPPLTRLPNPWGWDDLPMTCIVKIHFEWTKVTHWAIWHNNRFYDPSEFGHELLYKNITYPPGVRVTSYLPIFMQ